MLAMSAEAASERIQRAWRRSTKYGKTLLAKYVDPMPLIVNGLDFEGLSSLIQRKDVLVGTKNLLQYVLRMRGGHQNGEDRTFKTRVFLISFMMKRFPRDIFADICVPEVMEVLKASENMLTHWYEVIGALKRNEIPDTLEFHRAHLDYVSEYEKYKALDAPFVPDRINALQRSLHDIYFARANLERTDPEICVFNKLIDRIRLGFKRLAGGVDILAVEDAYERTLSGLDLPYYKEPVLE